MLASRFEANLKTLRAHRPGLAQMLEEVSPARVYHLQPSDERILIGHSSPEGIVELPQTIPPAVAQNLRHKVFPESCNQPLLVVGEDVGWLWNALYQLPCNLPSLPGHRPPLYFLLRDIEKLWIMLHVHDWRPMLADARVRLFVGEDAFDQFRASLVTDTMYPWPKLSIMGDPTLWPAGLHLNDVLAEAREQVAAKIRHFETRWQAQSWCADANALSQRILSGKPLRILGFTSRYTTFLQHSMRDWLSAFERLGHTTELVIEGADHEIPNKLVYAQRCDAFKPDLIVVIDHFRKEMGGLPADVPVVMWVQDALPNMFCKEAGAAQGRRDYALGFAQLKLTREFGYPTGRYMPAIVAVNDERLKPRHLSAQEQAKFACDVSFISHASMSAEEILRKEAHRLGSPLAQRLFDAVFAHLKKVYDDGATVTEPVEIRAMIDRAARNTGTGIPADQMPAMMELFTQRVNNALFRHQSLHWLAEIGVNLHLYGRGWENHPTLGRFAKGIADNRHDLAAIYQSSKISLQISPHGGVHQRVLEGLASGGFFLIRRCEGDLLERDFQTLWEWCKANDISSDAEIRKHATAQTQQLLNNISRVLGMDPFGCEYPLLEMLKSSEECGYIRSAGMVWGSDYDAVSYNSAGELQAKVSHFLQNETDRQRIAESMRQPVLERFTYVATSKRLVNFIANDLASARDTSLAAKAA